MILIREAKVGDIPLIYDLAHEIWWPAYSGILSDEQISFMLKNSYSESALRKQFNDGMEYLIAEQDGAAVGFAGYTKTAAILKINKLYILPSEQGKGTGKLLLGYIGVLAPRKGAGILELNVNRGNPALKFYKKNGFKIHESVDIPYYQFVLNDYVMRKEL